MFDHFGHFKRCSKESPAGRVWKIQALPAGDFFLTVPFCYFSLVGGLSLEVSIDPIMFDDLMQSFSKINCLAEFVMRCALG
jgi:hypothetical protein